MVEASAKQSTLRKLSPQLHKKINDNVTRLAARRAIRVTAGTSPILEASLEREYPKPIAARTVIGLKSNILTGSKERKINAYTYNDVGQLAIAQALFGQETPNRVTGMVAFNYDLASSSFAGNIWVGRDRHVTANIGMLASTKDEAENNAMAGFAKMVGLASFWHDLAVTEAGKSVDIALPEGVKPVLGMVIADALGALGQV